MNFDDWYFCMACERVWRVDTWRSNRWACPSDPSGHERSHAHVRWSQVAKQLDDPDPSEGAHFPLRWWEPGRSARHELRG